jgi:molybdate transport system substrate-binding protein
MAILLAIEARHMHGLIHLWRAWALAITACAMSAELHAAEVRVAVAANFAVAFEQIAKAFAAETGHTAVVSVGSTGKFYAQIKAGAPFDVLLAADNETPQKLEDEGLAVKGQRFTYARGQLVLWTLQPGVLPVQATLAQVQGVLRQGQFKHLAMANPQLAPYGLAALETLQAMQLYEQLRPKLVMGDNIAQAAQFVATGNAEWGLVALSQVIRLTGASKGAWWPVPAHLHRPLLQDAALLQRGAQQAAAQALMQYLKTDKARAWIRQHGYEN